MLISDYFSQHVLIITLLMVLLGLCMFFLQKKKFTKAAWLICTLFLCTSISIFVIVGFALSSKQVSAEDHRELSKLIDRFDRHSLQLEATYQGMHSDIDQIRLLGAKKSLTYKDLESVNYALTRDRINIFVFNLLKDHLK